MTRNNVQVSLHHEMECVERAVEVARVLTESETEETQWHRQAGIAAVLALVEARLVLVRRVLRGEVDPALILGPANWTAPEAAASDMEDIRLVPWSASETATRLEREAERARTQAKAGRTRR